MRGAATPGIWTLAAYFLRLGAPGFGGPVALVGQMQRERWSVADHRNFLWRQSNDRLLPSFAYVLIAAPILARHCQNPNVRGFIKGTYAAAIGTILGACGLLGRIAIGDWLTMLIAAGSLAILFRWKASNPLLMAGAAGIGFTSFIPDG